MRRGSPTAIASILGLSVLAHACPLTAAETAAETPGGMPRLREAALSGALYLWGHEAGDALAVLAAARLRKEAALPATAGDGAAGEGVALPLRTWRQMLDEARALAGDDPALIALADEVQAGATRGMRIGPAWVIARIAPGNGPDRIDYGFRGGELAEVYVEGGAGSNLDLSVRDEEGRTVCADSDPSNIAYCNWTPAHDATFALVVENRGAEAVEYVLITN